VSFGVPVDRPPNRAGVKANEAPIATRIAPKAPTMCLALIRAKALNVARKMPTSPARGMITDHR